VISTSVEPSPVPGHEHVEAGGFGHRRKEVVGPRFDDDHGVCGRQVRDFRSGRLRGGRSTWGDLKKRKCLYAKPVALMAAVGAESELALGDPFVALPAIIAREVDVLPAERGEGRDQGFVDLLPAQNAFARSR
jgi:hypothetical protein